MGHTDNRIRGEGITDVYAATLAILSELKCTEKVSDRRNCCRTISPRKHIYHRISVENMAASKSQSSEVIDKFANVRRTRFGHVAINLVVIVINGFRLFIPRSFGGSHYPRIFTVPQ